jgi:molecular chaperone HtpG
LKISVATDDQAKTISFTDAGIGMTHNELVENLGTIAHSGSKAFLEQIKANKGDAHLIGQFGVGFYSAFMVAEKVTVYTRSYLPNEHGLVWSSDGQSGYDIEPAADLPRGTKVVLQLREAEFAGAKRIEQIIKHYSNFVQFPIELNGAAVNTVQALWTKNKSEITHDEYDEFYKYIGHDTAAPLYHLHFAADAPLSIRALLFVPEKNYELLTLTRGEPEVNLYCRRVLIQPRATGLFPEWLRFLRGVVDSEDLPLNISRETMQDSALLRKLNDVLTKRVIKWLDEEARADAGKYDRFFQQHGHCLKEGIATDWSNRESLAKLLRFESSHTESEKTTALADYIARMPSEQAEIYWLFAPSRQSAESSPYFEVFREKKYEVLFLFDPRDEFVMDQLREFDGKKIVSAEKAELAIDRSNDEPRALEDDQARLLANFIKETLADKVDEVRTSKRLVGSPAVIIDSDKHLTASMRRMIKMMNRGDDHALAAAKPHLEINPEHPVIVQLEKMRHQDAALSQEVIAQIFDNALVAAGLLDDPRAMLGRLNSLLEKVLTKNELK